MQAAEVVADITAGTGAVRNVDADTAETSAIADKASTSPSTTLPANAPSSKPAVLPANEAQTRELARLPADKRAEAWETVTTLHGGDITALKVKAVVDTYFPAPADDALLSDPHALPPAQWPRNAAGRPFTEVDGGWLQLAARTYSGDTLLSGSLRGLFPYKGREFVCCGQMTTERSGTDRLWAYEAVLLADYQGEAVPHGVRVRELEEAPAGSPVRDDRYDGMIARFKNEPYVLRGPEVEFTALRVESGSWGEDTNDAETEEEAERAAEGGMASGAEDAAADGGGEPEGSPSVEAAPVFEPPVEPVPTAPVTSVAQEIVTTLEQASAQPVAPAVVDKRDYRTASTPATPSVTPPVPAVQTPTPTAAIPSPSASGNPFITALIPAHENQWLQAQGLTVGLAITQLRELRDTPAAPAPLSGVAVLLSQETKDVLEGLLDGYNDPHSYPARWLSTHARKSIKRVTGEKLVADRNDIINGLLQSHGPKSTFDPKDNDNE